MVPPKDGFTQQLVHFGGNQSCQQIGENNSIKDKH